MTSAQPTTSTAAVWAAFVGVKRHRDKLERPARAETARIVGLGFRESRKALTRSATRAAQPDGVKTSTARCLALTPRADPGSTSSLATHGRSRELGKAAGAALEPCGRASQGTVGCSIGVWLTTAHRFTTHSRPAPSRVRPTYGAAGLVIFRTCVSGAYHLKVAREMPLAWTVRLQ
ncbi:hypothetical protein PC119_g274 [Phytophthora cactorum]|nr:hypothetical protein PC114_g782 [Phytophthora cactorum]KAG3042175.1 hypothetical protein PC119_g274 [Phytophthora cactorum]KAG4064090.1 hypothetical protein PC123_g1116 [Phytophthora cactorum]